MLAYLDRRLGAFGLVGTGFTTGATERIVGVVTVAFAAAQSAANDVDAVIGAALAPGAGRLVLSLRENRQVQEVNVAVAAEVAVGVGLAALSCFNSSSVIVRPTPPTRPAAPVTRMGAAM